MTTGRRRLSAAIAVLLAGVALVVLPAPRQSAEAAIPAACGTPTIACARLYVADYRTGDFGLAPLAGGTFGLFLDNPTGTIDANDGFATPDADHPVYFTCTSDADGDCVFQVPIQAGAAAVGALQTAPFTDLGTGHVPQGTRLYAAPLAAPAGYYANPWWNTGPLSGATAQMAALRHVFQSPPLVGGQIYQPGVDWVSDPGLPTEPPTSVPGNDYARRVASAGRWPLARFNLDMPEQCGLDVALVVDVSSSVGTATPGQPLGARPALVEAMNNFVDALHGTPSRLALFTFGTDSPATGFAPNTPLRSVGTAAEAQAFKNLYDDNAPGAPLSQDWDDPAFAWPTNYTNWDRGFAAAADVNADPGNPDSFDLVVFVTDGNPTIYGPEPLTNAGQLKDRNSGYTRFREVGEGLASANLLKSQGTRVLAVGVGAGVSGEGSEENLRTVSGRDGYDGTNILDADYIQTTDYAAAGAALHDVVLTSCAPSISIVKRIVPNGATTTADATLPTGPWSLTVDATATGAGGGPVTITPTGGAPSVGTATAATEIETGSKAFDLEFGTDDAPVTLSFSETGQPGYTPRPELTECSNKTTESGVPVTTTPPAGGGTSGGALAVDLAAGIGVDDSISCVVYNEAPPSVVPASVAVHKQWEIHSGIGVELTMNGGQPTGMTAALELTGPDSAAFTAQQWATERLGYDVASTSPMTDANSVRIDEDVNLSDLPGCALGAQYITTGPPGPHGLDPLDPAVSWPLAAGLNEWTITNVVTCTSTLTLVKDVTNGPLDSLPDEQLWTLSATATPATGVPPLDGFSGATGTPATTSVEVMPGAVYALREDRPADPPVDSPAHYTYHYAQHDIRTQPPLYPDTSGSWDCRPAGDPTGDPSLGAEGAVVVPMGRDYECVARNSTALMTMSKTVLPSGDPSLFTFRAQWLPPLTVPPSQATPHDFQAGDEQSLVPGQHYGLTELDTPDYELASMTCTTAGEPFDPADFVLLPGAVAECVTTNQLGNWTAVKSSTPPSGSVVEPGDEVEYQVNAYQLLEGGVSAGVVVTDDLSGVLGHATLVPGSVTTTQGSATLTGTSLVWDVGTLTDAVDPVLTFRVVVGPTAVQVALDNVVTRNGGVDCSAADPPYRVGPFPADCDETHHRTPEPPPLPATGIEGPVPGFATALGAVALGVALVGAAAALRRRVSRGGADTAVGTSSRG